jgi:hypothetical protein
MNKCHSISWEGHNVGSTVGDSLLPLPVTVQQLCSALQKSALICPNIETKNLWSRVPHQKLGVAQQVTVLYGSFLSLFERPNMRNVYTVSGKIKCY